MKKLKLLITAITVSMIATTAGAFACTGMYVGKAVSKEGTPLIARSEDQGTGAYNKLYKVQPRTKKAGRYFRDTANGFKAKLPKLTYKFTYVRDSSDHNDGMYPATCTNEYGVAVVGTVSTEVDPKYEKVDPTIEKSLREATLPGLIACQVKTAKQAAELCAKLHDKYGSEEWNTLFFMDKKEAWIFENYGGHTYCAMKMPEDKVAVFGNQCMIGAVDRNDTKNYIFSKGKYDLFNKIDQAGLAVKENGQYNIAKSVSGNTRKEYSNMRTWEGHRVLAPNSEWVKGKEYSDKTFYPLFYKPEAKVSTLQIMDLFRDRYEGTKYDMNKPENKSRRPIGVTKSSDIHIIQNFANMPKEASNLQWLCMGNAEHSVFVPAFSSINKTDKSYNVDGAMYDARSAYWQFKQNETLAQSDRANLSSGTKDFWKNQEKKQYASILKAVKKVNKAYKKSKKAGRKYVTKLASKAIVKQLKNARVLYKALMYTTTRNDNDRVDRKVTFARPVNLKAAAKNAGFSYKKKKNDNKVYLKKGGVTYRLQLKSKGVHKNGAYADDLIYPIFKDGKTIYAPANVATSLNSMK